MELMEGKLGEDRIWGRGNQWLRETWEGENKGRSDKGKTESREGASNEEGIREGRSRE